MPTEVATSSARVGSGRALPALEAIAPLGEPPLGANGKCVEATILRDQSNAASYSR